MLIFKRIADLTAHLSEVRNNNLTIGFVPTMGALHQGHLSLIETSLNDGHYTVCSIFVNPAQFNDSSDLAKYPRTVEKDTEMLQNACCNVLFLPEVSEIYPGEDRRVFHFGHLDEILEAKFRPGHFNGVAKVVSILLNIVEPHTAYFGSKDYQQLLIVKELVKQLNLPVIIKPCAIVREKDGLAMSSRNMRLSSAEREAAALIPQLLYKAAAMKKECADIAAIKQQVTEALSHNELYKLEYFEICHPDTLLPLERLHSSDKALALIACFIGPVRLIDNLNI